MQWVEYVRLLEPARTRLVEQAEALVRRLDDRFPSLPEMCGSEALDREYRIRELKLMSLERLQRREDALNQCIEAVRSQLQLDQAIDGLEDDGDS